VYEVALARVTLVWVLLVGVLCARLLWVQGVRADVLAAQTVSVPDPAAAPVLVNGKPVRPRYSQINPRLRALAARVARGRILDRAGRVLAITRAKDNKRVYPFGAATGHLVGYLDPLIGGPTGIEQEFNGALRGFERWSDLVWYWRRKDTPGIRLPQGRDVVLALDAELQKTALALLQQRVRQIRDRRTGRPKNRGAVVLLDVTTGGILAAATSPVYDPNTLDPAALRTLGVNVDGDFPLINRALFGRYPPGSTFKVVTASGLLATGKADFTTNCAHVAYNVTWRAGGQGFGRQRITDDETDRPHGLVNLSEGISESCNVYFGRAGIALGPDTLRQQARLFAFDRLPTPAQFAAELPDIAYGQGPLLASPLEMAGVAQTIANGGVRLRPQLLKTAPRAAPAPLAPGDAARLVEAMRRVTRSGTAAGRFDTLPFGVAGKTGTAQNDQYDRMSHSWFIGFAPVEHPRIAIAVIAENGGYGASVAVPVARDVLRAAGR
jgi:peptidoglycan glycosyltransferase